MATTARTGAATTQQGAGDDDVERPLDGPGGQRRSGRLDVQQRLVGERRDGDPAWRRCPADRRGRRPRRRRRARPGSARRGSPASMSSELTTMRSAAAAATTPSTSASSPSHRSPRPAASASARSPMMPTIWRPASGWTSATRTSSMRPLVGADDDVGWIDATLAAVDRHPGAQQRAPDDEEDDRQHGGGDDPAQAQGRTDDAVDDEDAAEDGAAGPEPGRASSAERTAMRWEFHRPDGAG